MKERQYCLEKGAPVIEQHAADFVAKRLAPALPANDGKQTPMRGHPVFIAQHATRPAVAVVWLSGITSRMVVSLSEEQQRYIVAVIYHWLVVQMNQP
ncbi:putative cytoplasmic protein [Escherichia coli]|nr:putative cytoplasmic protein [Escherichia coli]